MKSWAFAAMFVTVGVFAACSTKSITPTGGTCGDGVCDANEDSLLCPADCGSSSSSTSSGTSTSTSSSTSSGTSTSSSTSSGTSTSSSTSSGSSTSSSSGSSSGDLCATPATTADCQNCTTKATCTQQAGSNTPACCENASPTGLNSLNTIFVDKCACAAGSTCESACNGATDLCKMPSGQGTMGCITCLNGLTNMDACIVPVQTACKADSACNDYLTCASGCGSLP